MLKNNLFFLKSSIFLIFFCSSIQANEFDIIPVNLSTHTPIVNATIKEKKIKISFDSGAHTALILNKKILDKTPGVTFTGNYRHSIDATGKKYKNPEFKLDKIILGNYKSHNITGNIYAPWGLLLKNDSSSHDKKDEIKYKKDGVFGLDLFKNKKLIIDYPKKNLVVLHNDTLPEPYSTFKWIECKQNVDTNGIVIEGIFSKKKGRFLLDTGATASFLRPSFLSIKDKKESVSGFFLTDKHAELGEIKFYLYEFVEPQVDGILGYDFFSNKKIYVEIRTNANNLQDNICFISKS